MKSSSPVHPHNGHRARLRAKLAHDAPTLADHEVLELFLGYGLTRKDTRPLAEELLRRFKSVRGVLDARPDELSHVPGFGPGLMGLWQVLRELLARYVASPVRKREELATPRAVADMARARLAGCPHEECWMALVNSKNGLIAWERLKRGGVNAVPVQPREVLEVALARKASGIILVHNHPGGSPEPSDEDTALTKELSQIAPRMGLRFLDHVIVTEGDCYSTAQQAIF